MDDFDRAYSFKPRMPSGSKWLLIVTIGIFLLQYLFDRGTSAEPGRQLVTDWLGLWSDRFRNGAFWQLATYMLVHSNRSLMHIFVNMLMLFFIGPETERDMGTRHFLTMYALSGVMGGLAWVLLHPYGVCVGASGAIFGVLGALTALHPHRLITVLIFFVFPVTMKTWVLAVGLMVIQLLFLFGQTGMNVAFDVHVAGGLAGYIYTLIVFRPEVVARLRHRLKMKGKLKVVSKPAAPNAAEIDRILDKVAKEGLNQLTQKEREILEHASRKRRS